VRTRQGEQGKGKISVRKGAVTSRVLDRVMVMVIVMAIMMVTVMMMVVVSQISVGQSMVEEDG
jgi:hypothetical protein